MTTTLETQVNNLLTGLSSALQAALEEAERITGLAQPCILSPMPGAIVAADYCEEGGMAWTRLVSMLPVLNENDGFACAVMWDITVEMGIFRCAPTLHEDNTLPTWEEQTAAMMLQSHDLGLMHKVLTCYPSSMVLDGPRIGEYQPFGPDGNCVGGFWSATWRMS